MRCTKKKKRKQSNLLQNEPIEEKINEKSFRYETLKIIVYNCFVIVVYVGELFC